MQEIIEIVSTGVFPVGVATYLLYERDRRTKEMTDVLTDLRIAIEKMGAR